MKLIHVNRIIAYTFRLGLLIGMFFLILIFLHPSGWEELASEEWFSFTLPWDDHSSSFTNLSASLKSAGDERSFVQVGEDGHFYLGDGHRIRFWGVAIDHQALFPSKKVAEQIASRLAKFGFNLVRVGSLDRNIFDPKFPNTQHFESKKLDRFDYLVKELKENGIYIDLVLTSLRKFKKGDQVVDWNKPNFSGNYAKRRLLRAMGMVDSHLMELQLQYAENLLDHLNPYTGNRYVNEPALATLEIINETTLDNAWRMGQLNSGSPASIKVTPYYSKKLDSLWNLWLLDNYGSREEVTKAWDSSSKKGLLPDEDPVKKSVKRILYSERNQFSQARVFDLQRFYSQLQKDYFTTFYRFLRNQVGVQVPISGTHTFHGMPNQIVQSQLDFTGIHSPWEHPIFKRGHWFRTLPFRFLNRPMVKAETTPTPYDAGWLETRNTIYKIAFGASAQNKPLVVSEYNHPYPNQYQAEFPLIISTYGSFQDWDGIIIHSYLQGLSNLESTMITNGFEIFNNPILMVQMPVASLMFRKNYVQTASKTLAIPYTDEQAFKTFLKCELDIHCAIKERGIDPHLSLVHGIRNQFVSELTALQPSSNNLTNPYRSDTGQLTWNIQKGKVLIDTPRVKGAVGFLYGKPIKVGGLTIRADTAFGAISLTSLDGKPIDNSSKLLLTAVGRMENTGMEIEQGPLGFFYLNDWGEEPMILQPVRAYVELETTRDLKVFRLDEEGKLGKELAVARSRDEEIKFAIGDEETLWYGLTPETTNPRSPEG